jgi:hypothetical protein
LVGKVREIHEGLNSLREKGNDFTLTEAAKTGALELSCGVNLKDITLDKLLVDLGIDRKRDTMQFVLELPEDIRWIVPEIFLEIIELGMRQNNDFYQAIIAGMIDMNTLTFQMPEISAYNIPDHGMNEGGIGTTPEEGVGVTFSSREVRTTKFERKISIPHEVAKYSSIDQLSLFLTRLAKVWGLQLTRKAIDVLINGDLLTGALAAATIGVDDSSNKLEWIDLIRIHARMGRLGYNPTTVVTTEENVVHVINLPEFKNLQQGRSLGEVRIQGRLPTSWEYYMHSVIDADHYVFLDPAFAIQELVSEGMRVESERLMDRDMSVTYLRIQNAFANILRDARVIVDQTLDYIGNEFPAWMDPID